MKRAFIISAALFTAKLMSFVALCAFLEVAVWKAAVLWIVWTAIDTLHGLILKDLLSLGRKPRAS